MSTCLSSSDTRMFLGLSGDHPSRPRDVERERSIESDARRALWAFAVVVLCVSARPEKRVQYFYSETFAISAFESTVSIENRSRRREQPVIQSVYGGVYSRHTETGPSNSCHGIYYTRSRSRGLACALDMRVGYRPDMHYSLTKYFMSVLQRHRSEIV